VFVQTGLAAETAFNAFLQPTRRIAELGMAARGDHRIARLQRAIHLSLIRDIGGLAPNDLAAGNSTTSPTRWRRWHHSCRRRGFIGPVSCTTRSSSTLSAGRRPPAYATITRGRGLGIGDWRLGVTMPYSQSPILIAALKARGDPVARAAPGSIAPAPLLLSQTWLCLPFDGSGASTPSSYSATFKETEDRGRKTAPAFILSVPS
jgi:hypothetical protein